MSILKLSSISCSHQSILPSILPSSFLLFHIQSHQSYAGPTLQSWQIKPVPAGVSEFVVQWQMSAVNILKFRLLTVNVVDGDLVWWTIWACCVWMAVVPCGKQKHKSWNSSKNIFTWPCNILYINCTCSNVSDVPCACCIVWLVDFRPVAINWVGNGPDAIATLFETGTIGVAPATVTVAPAGTVTLIPPGPTTGC